MANATTKIGHGLAKVLGIKVDYRDETGGNGKVSRGESVFSVTSADSYEEREPTAKDWLAEVWPSKADAWNYTKGLFPFTSWILHYNLQWLYGDLVAGMLSQIMVTIPDHNLLIATRYHDRCCSCAPKYGLRKARTAPSSIWSLLIFHGRLALLVLRYLERHHYRTRRSHVNAGWQCRDQGEANKPRSCC
jgi:hypothetical protein